MFKVGDVVECLVDCQDAFTKGGEYKVQSVGPDIVNVERDDSGYPNSLMKEYFRLAEPIESPVRTVTRREIVPGTYGCVEVEMHSYGMNVVADFSGGRCTAEELREAAHILNQIAEVLEENK